MLYLEPQLTNTTPDGWNRDATPMTRGNFGVWEVTVPAKDGNLGIPHNSKLKVRNTASTSLSTVADIEVDIPGNYHIARAN